MGFSDSRQIANCQRQNRNSSRKTNLQRKLSDIKTKYRSDEYLLETENDTDMRKLIEAFPEMKQIGANQLTFCESVRSAFDLLRFVSEQHIVLLKFERMEPTLESLFMEVTQK